MRRRLRRTSVTALDALESGGAVLCKADRLVNAIASRLSPSAGTGLIVFAECNPHLLEQFGSSTGELVEILGGQGLDVRWIRRGEGIVTTAR